MIKLPKGETYEIKTIEDVLNCPINMQMELIGIICEGFKARLEAIDESGKDNEIKNVKMSITNDGINKSHVEINKVKS